MKVSNEQSNIYLKYFLHHQGESIQPFEFVNGAFAFLILLSGFTLSIIAIILEILNFKNRKKETFNNQLIKPNCCCKCHDDWWHQY